jgi:hypothetical protein
MMAPLSKAGERRVAAPLPPTIGDEGMPPMLLHQPIQLPGILARNLAPHTRVQAAEVLLDHLE